MLQLMVGLLFLYPGLCVGYWLFHRFFVVHPSRRISRTPADLGMVFEEVFFPAGDQVRLQGWYLPGRSPHVRLPSGPVVILFFSGNEGTLGKFVDQMQPLQAHGFDVLMFSYRGFGKSARRWPMEKGLRQDARGAWNYLTQIRGVAPSQIVFYAQSLGCGLATWAAAQLKPAALILEGGFLSVGDLMAPHLPWLPVRWLTTQRFDTRAQLPEVQCPVLIMQSQTDPAVPAAIGQQLFMAARPPKYFYALRGGHAQGLAIMPREVLAAMIRFLRK